MRRREEQKGKRACTNLDVKDWVSDFLPALERQIEQYDRETLAAGSEAAKEGRKDGELTFHSSLSLQTLVFPSDTRATSSAS